MIKKLVATTLISAMSLFALPNSEMELYMVNKAIEKKAIVLSNMQLKDNQEAFGKLYDKYQAELMIQRKEELDLVEAYANDYKKLNNTNADKIMKDWIKVEENELALKKEYMLKFSRVLSSADVIRYFQIENRLQLLKEVQVSSLIPLAQNEVISETTQKLKAN